MKLELPAALKAEHQELHQMLVQATQEPGEIGVAAREVAQLLHPDCINEEAFALPPRGLLGELVNGMVRQEIADVLPMTRRLASEHQSILDDHKQIVGALESLREAALTHARPEYERFTRAYRPCANRRTGPIPRRNPGRQVRGSSWVVHTGEVSSTACSTKRRRDARAMTLGRIRR